MKESINELNLYQFLRIYVLYKFSSKLLYNNEKDDEKYCELYL